MAGLNPTLSLNTLIRQTGLKKIYIQLLLIQNDMF